MPLRLTDSELDTVMAAARPLEPARRDALLQAVAGALGSCREIGPGTVYRCIAEVQRQHFDAPGFNGNAASGKYGRSG